jgi:hypothetical protein
MIHSSADTSKTGLIFERQIGGFRPVPAAGIRRDDRSDRARTADTRANAASFGMPRSPQGCGNAAAFHGLKKKRLKIEENNLGFRSYHGVVRKIFLKKIGVFHENFRPDGPKYRPHANGRRRSLAAAELSP